MGCIAHQPRCGDNEEMYPDTIAAIATPPGRGGIGIVRLAGPEALLLAAKLVRLTQPLEHARARFVRVLDPREPDDAQRTTQAMQTSTIDEAVITAFLAPQSYTGDDVVEIAAHGSPVVLNAVLTAALGHGARLAEPGEFTQRAFLAGRLDLTQAEAVHDLIAAQTLEQARAAAQQLGGALSRRVAPAKEQLLHLIALLEAGMDFASGELDDVDVVAPAHVAAEISAVQAVLQPLAQSFRAGAFLRTGIALALVGRPNAGKSSLFNRLLQRPRAIVTPVPGTTRDTVEEAWSLNGIPVRLIDTAGLRRPDQAAVDEAERQGIVRSREALADADLVLLIHDASMPFDEEERALAETLQGRPHLLVRNKMDLLTSMPSEASHDADISYGGQAGNNGATPLSGAPTPPQPANLTSAKAPLESRNSFPTTRALAVSALTGEGMDRLSAAILEELRAAGGLGEAGALNNRRQQEAVLESLLALETAAAANSAALAHELLLVDLHTALRALDTLTGQTTTEDILTRIFSTFCIGK